MVVSIVMRVPQARWMVYFGKSEHKMEKWMVQGPGPISGNVHIDLY